MNRYLSWFILAASIISAFLLGSEVAYQMGWAIDESVTFLMAEESVNTFQFPTLGIINSFGFHNPNAMVWLTLPLALFFDHPLFISYALIFFHLTSLCIFFVLFKKYISTEQSRPSRHQQGTDLLLIAILLTDLTLLLSAPILWAQTIVYPFLIGLLLILLRLEKEQTKPLLIIAGYLFLFLPALHLSLFVLLPFAILPLRKGPWRRRLHGALLLALGGAVAFLLHWLPWLLEVDFARMVELRSSWQAGKPYEDISILSRFFGFTQWVNLLLNPFPDGHGLTDLNGFFLGVSRVLRLALVLFAITMLVHAYQKRLHPIFNQLGFCIISFALIFSILSLLGKSPYEERANIGQIYILPLMVIVIFIIREFLLRAESTVGQSIKWLRPGALVFLSCLLLSRIITLSFPSHEEPSIGPSESENKPFFSIFDLPIGDKSIILDGLIDLAKEVPSGQFTVAYEVEGWERFFGYIEHLDRVARHDYYRKNALFDYYLSAHSARPDQFQMVDIELKPDFLILHPVQSSNEINLHLGVEDVVYEKVLSTPSLALWTKVPDRSP